MKFCVVDNNGTLMVWKVIGEAPENCVGHLSLDTAPEDFKFVALDSSGQPFICQKKKSAWIKEQIKNGISE